MRKFFAAVKEVVRNLDPGLFWCVIALCGISLLTIFGAVENFGHSKLRMQIAMFLLGTVLTILLGAVDFRAIVDKLWLPLLIGSAALLILTLIVGTSGANMETANKSWLRIPFTGQMIQPSEFVKVSFICTFSKHLFTVRERINRPLVVLGLAAHAGLFVGLILLSGDLGVALVYLAIIGMMLFCAGLHLGYFAGVAGAVALASPYIWDHLTLYQQRRIVVGFDPSLDPVVYGWQALLSKQTISAGGFFGKGVFGGVYYEDLTASHTDFIFATICEKFGFIGGSLVILLYIFLVVRIFMIARTAGNSDYGGLICVGVGGMFVAQILENIGMNLAMLPVVGITLPFLSCGGSSLLATFLMMGLVHSVYSHSNGVRREKSSQTLDLDSSLFENSD